MPRESSSFERKRERSTRARVSRGFPVGGAANVGGCIAGYTVARLGLLPARWPPPAPVRPLPASPEVSAAGLFAEEGVGVSSSLG